MTLASAFARMIALLFLGFVLILGVVLIVDGWKRGIDGRWMIGLIFLLVYPALSRAINRITDQF